MDFKVQNMYINSIFEDEV